MLAQLHHCQHLFWATQQAAVEKSETLGPHPFRVSDLDYGYPAIRRKREEYMKAGFREVST